LPFESYLASNWSETVKWVYVRGKKVVWLGDFKQARYQSGISLAN
jgi:hypothetical protein